MEKLPQTVQLPQRRFYCGNLIVLVLYISEQLLVEPSARSLQRGMERTLYYIFVSKNRANGRV